MLLVYFVIAAIPIGYLAGGRLGNIKYARLRLAILPCAAFLLEASFGLIGKLLDAPPSEWLGKIVCLEYLLLVIFIWCNHHMRGMDMLGAATLVNFLVIAVNGFRMPVTPIIYEYPGLYHFVERIQTGELPEYVLVDWDGPLWFLGDTLPIGTGLASIGDLLMALGVLILIVDMMRAKPPRKRRRYHLDDHHGGSRHSKNYHEDRYDHGGHHHSDDHRYYKNRRHHKRTRWS